MRYPRVLCGAILPVLATMKAAAMALRCPVALGFNKGHGVLKNVSKARHSLTKHTKFMRGMIQDMLGYILQAMGHRAAQNVHGQALKLIKERVRMRICPESKRS